MMKVVPHFSHFWITFGPLFGTQNRAKIVYKSFLDPFQCLLAPQESPEAHLGPIWEAFGNHFGGQWLDFNFIFCYFWGKWKHDKEGSSLEGKLGNS